jgi:hypothetical protein
MSQERIQNEIGYMIILQGGGRIALTTDSWTGANKCDYTAVTAHGKTKTGEMWSTLIDIIELTAPVHDGHYLCTKLLEVTNRLGITCAIISITRDNVSSNDTMLEMFEAVVLEQWEHKSGQERLFFSCRFNRVEGDVRCCAHIYNIAVQAGKLYPNRHFTNTDPVPLKYLKPDLVT